MAPRFDLIKDGFFSRARELRAVFDERFSDPRSTREDRFVWDYWHVPEQYTLLRTPAWEYFPQALYREFHESLVNWGRRTLGCWDVSPPWLSCYVEGCQQQLHADVPHGPWAWVFSLTPTRARFRGGETLILRPEVLDYWPGFNDTVDRELSSFVKTIPSKFNRLVCFDPRFPHGVTRLTGTHDPREGRLVVHGWFTEPRIFVEGARTSEQVDAALEPVLSALGEALVEYGLLHGMLSVRLRVDRAGAVEQAKVLANTLIGREAPGQVEVAATRRILKALRKVTFGKARGSTEITLPLLFR
jgi:hypothetical protein